jgi:radical SAM superfamily enzyme YgiQ (UPF0313 family)
VYATTNSSQVIRDPNIDVVVIGEGEYVFRDIIKYLSGDDCLPDKGICYRDFDTGETINRGHSEFIKDLNKIPFPSYDLIDFSKYANNATRKSIDSPKAYPYARITTSRGCPFNCVFCQVKQIAGNEFRARSINNVLEEIQFLKDKYGIKSIIFDDDNLLVDRERSIDLFQGMIDRGLAMPWVMIATAVFKLDEELIKLMKTSGCDYIDIAIETGTERVMKEIIHKPVNFGYAKRMVKFARSIGIYVAANFIIGFPTETWNEIRRTLKMAEDIDADYVKISPAIPLCNTELWELCKKEEAFKDGVETNKGKWSTGQIETKEFSANELIILRAYEWDRINFTDREKLENTCKMMDVSIEEMEVIRKETIRKAHQSIGEKQ